MRGRRDLLILAAVALVLCMSGAAVVAAVVADEAVHGCVGPQGALRISDTCRPGEEALSLAPAGAPQPVAGHEVVQVMTPLDTNSFKSAVAYCPEGRQVLGGGVTGVPSNTKSATVINSPNHGGEMDANGKLIWDRWEARAYHTGGESWRLIVSAICGLVE